MTSRIIPFPSLRLELQQVPTEARIAGVAPLDTPVEFMRYCYACDSDQLFIADRSCLTGLVGRCKCGDERIVPFTRTNSAPGWEELT